MAITAVNAGYVTNGPTASNQILASSGLSDAEVALVFTATAILDGSTTSFTLNFIDGTKTLSFTPTGVIASVIGGTQQAATPISVVGTQTPTTTGVTVNLSAVGTAANTVTIAGFILR